MSEVKKAKRKDSQVTGNVGLYYVCYRLSCLGWNVMPTARNAKGVDILIYNYDASIKLSVQVKALSKRSPVPLGTKTKLEHLFADFVVVCRNVREKPESFILTPDEVRKLADPKEKDGKVSVWLQPRDYEAKKYRDAWERIGLGGEETFEAEKAFAS